MGIVHDPAELSAPVQISLRLLEPAKLDVVSVIVAAVFEHEDKLVLAAVQRTHAAIVLDPDAEVFQLVIDAAAGGEELKLGERVVGWLGSTTVSPTLGPIALALVRREAEPGALVLVGEREASAEIVALPFPSTTRS